MKKDLYNPPEWCEKDKVIATKEGWYNIETGVVVARVKGLRNTVSVNKIPKPVVEEKPKARRKAKAKAKPAAKTRTKRKPKAKG